MNRSTFPNGGWSFFQPQTNWWAPAPVSNTFDQQVVNIIKHRRANPAVTGRFKLATDPATVGAELEEFTAKRLGLPDPKLSPPPTRPQLGQGAVAAVAAVEKLAAGAALLLEWQESGQAPVAPALAEKRAAICAVCPKNEVGGFTKYFTAPVADNIRRRLARLHEMNLTTPSDDKLQVCAACLCPLRLKVWCPMDLIQARLKPEQRVELDPNCWILAGT